MPHPMYIVLGIEVWLGFISGLFGLVEGWRGVAISFAILSAAAVALSIAVGLMAYGIGAI